MGEEGSAEKVGIYPTREVVFEAHRRFFLDKRGEAAAPLEGKVGINRRFARQFDGIWAIVVPRLDCRETAFLLAQLCLLMGRTYLSLLVARLDGRIVRDLVSANGRGFVKGLGLWFVLAVPASYTNSMIRFMQQKISIAFRTRLTRYVHDLYLNDRRPYYKILTDGEIEGVDQFITTDITHFCDSCAALLSNLGKPLIDLFVFNYQLTKSLGPGALIMLLSAYFSTAYIIRKVSPAFGRLAAVEARLEGEFRNGHARLITNAEEIAFYNGGDRERMNLEKSYGNLSNHIDSTLRIRIAYNWFEDYIIKYCWSSVGMLAVSGPIFFPGLGGLDGSMNDSPTTGAPVGDHQHSRTRGFITNKRLLLSLAEAGGRMMYSYKDLASLAGYTARVYALLSSLHRVHANAYSPRHIEHYSLADVQGTVQTGYDGIRLEEVPIVAPARRGFGGEELIESLTLKVKTGQHVLISGGNGTGKTAIARVIAGLWPVYRGLVSKPSDGEIMYVPQKPYLSVGTLRDQLIYPSSHADMVSAGRRDRELLQILERLKLDSLVHREGGWETKKDWNNVLSGGERQRINLARLFYHRPRFAVLDEATSAVSSDVEGTIYLEAKRVGVTLMTISHRPSLLKYHTHRLNLVSSSSSLSGASKDVMATESMIDGDAPRTTWQFDVIGEDHERTTVEHDIVRIERELRAVPALQARKAEIDALLAMSDGNIDVDNVGRRGQ